MEEIRKQICREEGMTEIPSFEDVPTRREEPAATTDSAESEKDWPLLLASLQYVNNGYDIPYYWSFGPNSLKTFAKRVVRKLLKCLIPPILAMQNAFNAHVVRCLNQLRYFVESIHAQLDGNKQELNELRQRILRLEQEMQEMDKKLRRQESASLALIAEQTEKLCQIEWQTHELEQVLSEKYETKEDAVQRQGELQEEIERLQRDISASVREEVNRLREKFQETVEVLDGISSAAEETSSQCRETAGMLEREREHIQRWQDDRDTKIQAMARDIIRTKWAFTDYMENLRDTGEDVVQCGICGYSGEAAKLEKKVTECIFDGGKLVRYVCPECGAIFGPTKFNTLKKDVRDDDYTVHYTGYHEGDSTDKEVKTFMRLEPSKDGIYLNYGCGSWSQTMQRLHDLGYCVYGYEPYSRDMDNPYIISDRAALSKMRFHGIFSNDVLEHLIDPVAELRFMKTLLAKPDALMAHTTGCFDYKYEYTRFHMFFFTGNSLNVVCEKAGLNLIEVSDAESEIGEKDFHCRIFSRKEMEIDYLPMACVNSFAEISDSEISLHPDGICYGPYITLPAGEYMLGISLQLSPNVRYANFKVTSQRGERTLRTMRLLDGDNQVEFSLEGPEEDVEFVIENESDGSVILKKLALIH